MVYNKFKRKGMRVGGSHKWKYYNNYWNETKVSPKKWRFTYYQTKRRQGRHAPTGSGFPKGGKLHWRIVANQYATKTGANTYKLVMKGVKYRKGWKKKYDKRWR